VITIFLALRKVTLPSAAPQAVSLFFGIEITIGKGPYLINITVGKSIFDKSQMKETSKFPYYRTMVKF
jgi:hypothetical protein